MSYVFLRRGISAARMLDDDSMSQNDTLVSHEKNTRVYTPDVMTLTFISTKTTTLQILFVTKCLCGVLSSHRHHRIERLNSSTRTSRPANTRRRANAGVMLAQRRSITQYYPSIHPHSSASISRALCNSLAADRESSEVIRRDPLRSRIVDCQSR